MTALTWTAVVVIGGAGSVLRFLVDRAVVGRLGRALPVGTLTVNITGAALLGLVTGLALSRDASLIAGTAAVGSYTTFSTWMFETQRLSEERQLGLAVASIVVSVVLGVAAVMLGQAIGSRL